MYIITPAGKSSMRNTSMNARTIEEAMSTTAQTYCVRTWRGMDILLLKVYTLSGKLKYILRPWSEVYTHNITAPG